jgi:hypothetical protein
MSEKKTRELDRPERTETEHGSNTVRCDKPFVQPSAKFSKLNLHNSTLA